MSITTPTVLLSSTFKPCGVDDAYGRKECVAEVHHNQLTQFQGVFSPRYWWPSMGTHLMGPNLGVPVTVLDWPALEQFEREVRKGYDYVGISFVVPTFLKFKKMCERVRELSPRSKIIAGGFGVTLPGFAKSCEVDYVCEGEGIRYMRNLLGQPPAFEFKHPDLHCQIVEFLGTPTRAATALFRKIGRDISGLYTNILITGLGCKNGCDFCSTSHFYDCVHLPFLRTGQEIFDLMREKTNRTGSNAFFFLGDENFYIDRKRMEELWALQRDSGRDYVIRLTFGSVEQIERYDLEMLAELDIDHVWIGLESHQFPYPKTQGRDPRALMERLKSIGVKVILSSILFLDGHTKENLGRDIDYHVSLRPDHSQFAGLAVCPGTPLWEKMEEEGRILHEIPQEERHAFKQIWFSHPEFSVHDSGVYQRHAYMRDFYELGPAAIRSILTSARAAPSLLASPRPRIRRRGARLMKEAQDAKPLVLAAAKLADDESMKELIRGQLSELVSVSSPLSSADRAKAEIIAAFGRAWKVRRRLGLDVIQPRPVKTFYPGK